MMNSNIRSLLSRGPCVLSQTHRSILKNKSSLGGGILCSGSVLPECMGSYIGHGLSSSYSTSSHWNVPIKTKFNLPDPSTQYDHDRTHNYVPKLTKIVATIGPTSEQLPVLQQVVNAGMRIMRLNFSHATVEEVELRTNNLYRCHGRHSMLDASDFGQTTPTNLRAVLLDTKGPEIRSGRLAHDQSGHETIRLVQGSSITLQTTNERRDLGSTEQFLYIDYANLHRAVQPGMRILLDDGAITLAVTQINGTDVLCEILNSGELRSRAGVNLPGANTDDIPAMSEKDKADILYGMSKDMDYIAASFVQTADGVRQIRQHIEDCAKKLQWSDDTPRPLLISKIESLSALTHFDEILAESDGIMVARGDLGVELALQQVTNAQKEMVAACNAAGKPVIVATQMLESMAKNPRPTRAEVADVTNAIYDGADCVMLSGETAKGKYPVESVKIMNDIVLSAERFAASYSSSSDDNTSGSNRMFMSLASQQRFQPMEPSMDATIAKAAVTAANSQHATAIMVSSESRTLPALVSAFRPNVPILYMCPNAKLGRLMMIYRGVHPIVGMGTMQENLQDAQDLGFVQSGDSVIYVTTTQDEATMKLIQVP
jgi:pyruvate kinase